MRVINVVQFKNKREKLMEKKSIVRRIDFKKLEITTSSKINYKQENIL